MTDNSSEKPRKDEPKKIWRWSIKRIVIAIILAILFVLWAIRQCEGIKEERKTKKEFRESFEHRWVLPEIDTTAEFAEEIPEADRGERPSIEVREQKPEPVDTIKTPENPESPDNPVIQVNPENIEAPDIPEKPEAPEKPATPDIPETPVNPENL